MILETTVIVSIVGWAASPVVNKLVGKLQWYSVQRYTWHQGLPEKLETLAHFLDEIGSTVNVVGAQGFRDPKMMGWLCQLRGAADEVDHIFDVLDYEIIGSSSSSQAAAYSCPNVPARHYTARPVPGTARPGTALSGTAN